MRLRLRLWTIYSQSDESERNWMSCDFKALNLRIYRKEDEVKTLEFELDEEKINAERIMNSMVSQ